MTLSSVLQISPFDVAALRGKLANAQTEAATSRFADPGNSLGYGISKSISLRQSSDDLEAIQASNTVVTTRLASTQSALKDIQTGVQAFVNDLIAAQSNGGLQTLKASAQAGLSDFFDRLNTQAGGAYVFGGVNSGVRPVSPYDPANPNTGQQSTATAFQATFGFPQSSPNVANLSSSDIASFLNGPFAAEFSSTGWSSTWSSASSTPIINKISLSERETTSLSANDTAFRQLAQAYVMVTDTGVETMNSSASQTVIQAALSSATSALKGLNDLQSRVGIIQAQVSQASNRMNAQAQFVNTQITTLESVDPYEASSRVSALTLQLQTSYSLTGQLRNLSLLNYLSPSG